MPTTKVTCPRCEYTFQTSTAIRGSGKNRDRLYTQCYRCKKHFPIRKTAW